MQEKNINFIPNSTQIPNIILDFVVPQLPEAEARCLLYICRRTYGFHKKEDRISFTQFMNGIKSRDGKILDYGAGLARTSVSDGLSNLVKSGIVLCTKTTKGNIYSINLKYPVNKSVDKMVKEVVGKVYQYRKVTKSGRANRPKQVVLPNLQYKGKKGNKVFIKNFKKEEKPKEIKINSIKILKVKKTKLLEKFKFQRT